MRKNWNFVITSSRSASKKRAKMGNDPSIKIVQCVCLFLSSLGCGVLVFKCLIPTVNLCWDGMHWDTPTQRLGVRRSLGFSPVSPGGSPWCGFCQPFMLEFAAQSWWELHLCGVTSVIFLEGEGSYISSRDHQKESSWWTKGEDGN